ncbi:MAG: ABC transporter permease [Bacillota bacterium]|nr:ABC transporter permease [Bacillota bacterium]
MLDKNQVKSLLLRFWFSSRMAAHGILSNPLRSALTVLGVAIGVASVVSLMGIGEGARRAVVEQFESLGSNVIVIKSHNPNYEFMPEEAEELVERVDGLEMASPIVQTNALMKWMRTRGKVDIIGTNQSFPEIRDHDLVAGHFFTRWHVEQRTQVAVLGSNIGNALLGGRNPVGRSISLNGESFRIIGVLEAKGRGKADNIDDKIIIPYTVAQKFNEKRTVEEIWGKADSKNDADLAIVQLGRIFKRKLGLDQKAPTQVSGSTGGEVEGMIGSGMSVEKEMAVREMAAQQSTQPIIPEAGEDVITITSLNQLVEEADNANRIMTLLLGGIAAVSLLVGGLGIMNIMLVAVTERTEEIGVRRALGAKREDLLLQFLLEALYVSLIGSIAGIVAGIWGVNIFRNYGFETAVSFQAIRIATLVAVTSGLLFGIYPAVSASSVPPVEALRRQ